MSDRSRFLLDESRIPKAWYNVSADLPTPPTPVLHPGTMEPVTPDFLSVLFPTNIVAQEVTPEIAKYFGLPEKTGVILTEVKAGGPADEAGLKPRDIVLKINTLEISDLKDYSEALAAGDKGEALLVLVRRGKANFFVTLKTAKEEKK